MGFRIYRTSDGAGIIRYEKISTSPIGGGGKSLRTATRIVAASNSLDKSSADYVCDGVHDEEEINRAISDLADVGGTVLLLEGTYNIGSAGTKVIEYEGESIEVAYGIYITSNVRLIGQGSSTILVLDSSNFDIGNAFAGAIILSYNTAGVEISHLIVDSNQQNVSFPVIGIYMISVSNSEIYCCNIQNSLSGIFFIGSKCTIADNIISDCIGFYSISINSSNNCIISGNICNNNAGGIILYYSNGNTVSNNECCNSTIATGIEVYNSSNNYIGGNVCISNEYGIYIEANSSSNVVCNNVVCMNGMDGICIVQSNDNLISENLIAGNSMYGIESIGGSYNTISGNVLRHMETQGTGIYVGGTGNLIINNDLYQAGTSTDFYDEGTDTVYHNNRTTEEWVP
jgi:parallel beta-helix repeat protein